MQTLTVGVEVGHDVDGQDPCVESLGVFEIIVPDLINNIAKESRDSTFGGLITGVVIKAGFMGRFCMNSDDCRGVIVDVFIVEGEAGGTYEFLVAMVGLVLGDLCEDGHEGMNTLQLVIINDHEDRDKLLSDGEEVIIGWLPVKGREGVRGLFDEAGDSVRRHVAKRLAKKLLRSSFLGYRRAVENRDDDDQRDCVGKGEWRVLGAFGDLTESVGSRDRDCSLSGFIGIKFELDFHCRER